VQVSATLLLELGVILTALTVLGSAARRFALSPIPLYLVAGLALGEGGIAPIPAAAEFVSTGASIGVVLLLLTLGLDFSIGEFASSLRRHLPSAWVDLVLNAVPGAIAGGLLGLNAGSRHCSAWRLPSPRSPSLSRRRTAGATTSDESWPTRTTNSCCCASWA